LQCQAQETSYIIVYQSSHTDERLVSLRRATRKNLEAGSNNLPQTHSLLAVVVWGADQACLAKCVEAFPEKTSSAKMAPPAPPGFLILRPRAEGKLVSRYVGRRCHCRSTSLTVSIPSGSIAAPRNLKVATFMLLGKLLAVLCYFGGAISHFFAYILSAPPNLRRSRRTHWHRQSSTHSKNVRGTVRRCHCQD
jgi:hypothetical protein